MNRTLILFCYLCCCTVVVAQNIEDDIKKLQASYCKAVEEKDSVFLKNLFHDNMIVTGGNGSKRSKAEEIKDALDPRYKVNFFKSRKEDIRVFGETAVVTGELFWEAVYQGNTAAVERSFTFTYTKTPEGWKIVAQHIGRVPTPPNKG